ncbi:MAG: isoleucine--tRNA ligase [Flavobacteriales bacterium]
MANKYPTYKSLNLPNVASEVLENWKREDIFEKSISSRDENKPFIFFEGPPSANGLPGIHHVMGRAIKDIFCRYKTLQGFQVNRKAGWDTHGLPVELGVEKALNITKEDIGKKITIEEYNKACKESVMKYTDVWNNLTEQMGYWVDMEDPYVTYDNKYIESVWWILNEIYNKDLMYKGYTIQPYSPAAGTGLSSHELNMPGCYKDVKDTTVVAQFKVNSCCIEKVTKFVDEGKQAHGELFFLAWTTTPWTLPSNTALAVGKNIDYLIVKSFNQYTFEPITVVLAENLLGKHFSAKNSELSISDYKAGDKAIPFEIIGKLKGSDLEGRKYEQLMQLALPHEDADKAFKVILGDFVTTADGTGIVHIAPTFGQDDAKVAKDAGVPPMLIMNDEGKAIPLVDLQGRFLPELGEKFGGKYVKNEYYNAGEAPEKSLDVEIAIDLKEQNRAFKVEKYEHSYPHCWRTDKPVLYYPLDSWFIKSTHAKHRMQELNETINWKPESTGTGRFGEWLKNLNDWNLSRSRYWGIPIPIWTSEDKKEQVCISSVEQLKAECEKSIAAGLMTENPFDSYEIGNMSKENYDTFDLHKNFVDSVILVSPSGQPMTREADLIDVWFDSGSMPYAQWHYPFENKEEVENKLRKADFIAEGVDQTRGWFFTLHAISTMLFDDVAYKNVISNGLVLDKNGQKMSKRLGNGVDPFETLDKFGPDATRWYMITNAQPWDNLKFDTEGIIETQRKFFGTLYNTYSFFALYANIDGFSYKEAEVENRPEIDQWILSKLNTLINEVQEAYESYEPTKVGRLIQSFTIDQLSNWYVRLCRRRFWKGEYAEDKISAYQTLYTCLETIAILMSPISPFFADRLYLDLNKASGKSELNSVHLAQFPDSNVAIIDEDLEEKMEIAQQVSSMVLSLRQTNKLKVRQPLQRIMVPILDAKFESQITEVKEIILSEVNVKELELLKDTTGVLVKKVKPNFKVIGKSENKKHMKSISMLCGKMKDEDITELERNKGWKGDLNGEIVELSLDNFDITTDDIPGWLIANNGSMTVALDTTLNEELINEGVARELVNRIQNLRKDNEFEVTDRVVVTFGENEMIQKAVATNEEYIKIETLTDSISFSNKLTENNATELEFDKDISIFVSIEKK